MAQVSLDSDLYGDIYGDDDFEHEASTSQEPEELIEDQPVEEEEASQSTSVKAESSENALSTLRHPGPHTSLPPKPSQSNLSYSAQIAQQFSAYQQTPSQERQQRSEIPLPANPRTLSTANALPETSSITPSTDSIYGKKPSEMHDAGKLFIGGLNWTTTDEGLVKYFSQFGKVDACTIMRDPTGKSRGFAFLTYEDPLSINGVFTRDHILDGKPIDPKRAIPREEHLRNTRYFVGGLAANTTSESMREFFGTYGKVVDATVMIDRESGRSKGFGFVTFEDANNADQLVGKIGLVLDDKQIEVKMAQPRSQRDQNRISNTSDTSEQEPRTQTSQVSFPISNTMGNTMMQRNQSNMMGSMSMMNMNPMAMAMGMGMNGFSGMGGMYPMNMMGGMNGMPLNFGGMNGMGGMNAMGGIGGINLMNGGGMNNMAMMNSMGGMGMIPARLGTSSTGMGIAGPTNTAMTGPMNVGMRPGQIGSINSNLGRVTTNAGIGPARVTSRGQHNFHPYAR